MKFVLSYSILSKLSRYKNDGLNFCCHDYIFKYCKIITETDNE